MVPDPGSGRAAQLLSKVAETLQVPPVPYGGTAVTPVADYGFWTNKIYVSPSMANTLTDYQLGCVLAHELGHARTRGRRVVTLLAGLVLRIGLPVVGIGVLGACGLLVGGVVVLLTWLGFVRADIYLRLWEEAPADDFGAKFAGSPAAYLAVLGEVARCVAWVPDPLFYLRAARLVGGRADAHLKP